MCAMCSARPVGSAHFAGVCALRRRDRLRVAEAAVEDTAGAGATSLADSEAAMEGGALYDAFTQSTIVEPNQR